MNAYLAIKHTHIVLALVSVAGFIARGIPAVLFDWRPGSAYLRAAPHVLDTLLLLSGITLMVMASMWPQHQPWLLVKLVLLVVYIGLAMLAVKPGRPRGLRILSFVLSLAAFAWMLAAARYKSPTGLMTWLGWS